MIKFWKRDGSPAQPTAWKNIKGPYFSPYRDYKNNLFYNMYFCDSIDLYKAENPQGLLAALQQDPPDIKKLQSIGGDANIENRYRALACHLLATNGSAISKREVLGIIFEISSNNGLDTFAVFSPKQMRVLSYSGKIFIYEIGNGEIIGKSEKKDKVKQLEDLAVNLFEVTAVAIKKLGSKLDPWKKPRRPPPNGLCRITFLMPQGLSFVEGPFNALIGTQHIGDVLKSGTRLFADLSEFMKENGVDIFNITGKDVF